MSRKRTKQYLMLLMVVGLVSIAAGGGGTFASFSAETTNAGNYFATGTLVLNDNGGTNTCTSATGTGTVNTANSSGTDCDTLFKVGHFQFAATTLTTPNPLDASCTATCALVVAATTGDAIYPGDVLTITDGTQTDTMTAKTYAAVGATAVTVDATTLGSDSFAPGATITDNSDTQLASLTLTNAGTIDAKDILFKAGNACASQYTEPHTTLDMGSSNNIGDPSGTTLTIVDTLTARFKAGDTLVVSEGGHANTFVVASDQSSGTSVDVTASQGWNYAYDTSAVVSGPEFNGGSAHLLCTNLKFSIVETTGTFGANLAAAAGCATGNTTAPLAAPSACNFSTGAALSAISTSTFTPLSIATTANGNTTGLLNKGGKRTFILAVHYDGLGAFDNTYQNTSAAAFDLTWHIDQV